MATRDEKFEVEVDDERLSLAVAYDHSLFVVELYGDLDLASARPLMEVIARAEETSAVTILVDLSGLRFLDSSGISLLMDECRRSALGSDRLRLLRPAGQAARTIELSGVGDHLPFLD